MKKTFKLKGMDCPSCATLLECDLDDAGIKTKVSYKDETLTTDHEDDTKIQEIVEKSGYKIVSS